MAHLMANKFLIQKTFRFISVLCCLLFAQTGYCDLESDIMNGVLPAGVPATTYSNGNCMQDSEEAAIKEKFLSDSNTMSLGSCEQRFIKPVEVVRGNIYYVPGSGSLTDCRKYRINKIRYTEMKMAVDQIIEYAESKITSSSSNQSARASQCLANVYKKWADKKGLVKRDGPDDQVYFYQMWYTGSLAAVFLKFPKLRSEIGRKNYRGAINTWFSQLGAIIHKRAVDALDPKKPPYSPFGINNMQHARGFSLLGAALITQNNLWIEKSRKIFDAALETVTSTGKANEKGYLPSELQRRSRALSYHEASLTHLLGILRLSHSFHCSFLDADWKKARMAFLIRKVIEGHHNLVVFEKASEAYDKSIGKYSEDHNYVQGDKRSADYHLETLGYGEDRVKILGLVMPYLEARDIKIRLSSNFSDSWYYDTKLGGNARLLPRPGSVWYPKNRPGFCKEPDPKKLAEKFFSI